MFLVKSVYIVTNKLHKEETYALADQMRHACASVASDIAEGYERGSTKEYVQFLVIERASKAELETQLQICTMLNYLTTEEIAEPLALCEEVGKMLNSIINKLKLPDTWVPDPRPLYCKEVKNNATNSRSNLYSFYFSWSS